MQLVLPEPQPTELIDSILLRVARVNGFTSWPELARCCRIRKGESERIQPRVATLVEAACRLYGWTEEQVIRRHTVIPYEQAFTRHPQYWWDIEQLEFRLDQFGGPNDIARHPRFCPSCLAEDRQWHAFSFLRRHHQIHGVTVCMKHQVSLHQVRFDPLRVLPEEAAVGEVDILQQTPLPEIGRRFHQVAETILDWPRPHRRKSVSVSLCERAYSRGFATAAAGLPACRTLGSQLFERTDENAAWICDLLQDACVRRSTNVAVKINLGLYWQGTHTSSIVAAALLLADSADDALALLSPEEDSLDDVPFTPAIQRHRDEEVVQD